MQAVLSIRAVYPQLRRTDCVLGISVGFVNDNTGPLGRAVRVERNIGSNDIARLPEQVLHVLPRRRHRELHKTLNDCPQLRGKVLTLPTNNCR